MSLPTLSLWIDAGEPELLARWMEEGHLPNFSRMERGGFFATLESFDECLAEIVQAVAITGCGPETNHYWGTHWYEPETYSFTHRGGYDFLTRKPFFALGPDRNVALIDLPQYRIHEDVHGLQLVGWGAHSPMSDFVSEPPGFAAEVEKEFGMHPTLGPAGESAIMEDPESMQRLFDNLLAGLATRCRLIKKIIDRERWDLLVTCLCETHKGGHYFYPQEGNSNFTRPDDPYHHLREIYRAMDAVLGELLDHVGDEWNVVAYSIEGIGNNNEELSGIFALPEILLRDSLGAGAFEFEEEKRVASPEREAGILDWTMEAWNLRRRPGPLTRWLRKRFPIEKAIALERSLRLRPSPVHPLECDYLQYQPARWLKPYWPHLRAFALPTFSDGFVRINLEGREGSGIVPVEDYASECDRIIELLSEVRHATTGEPMILGARRTRDDPFADGHDLPYADVIAKINNDLPTADFVSDRFGRIGPFPPMRSGSHTPRGFFLGKGPSIPVLSERIGGDVLDFAPTVLHLAGLAPAQEYDGTPLVEPLPLVAACLCVRDEERFLRENLLYHHAVGVHRIYLFADRCVDATVEIGRSLPWVEVFELDPADTDPLPYITDIHTRVMDRALEFARRDGFDWLLTLDADELAFAGNLDRDPESWDSMTTDELLEDADLPAMLAEVPEETLEVRLTTREAVPALEWAGEPFHHQSYFYGPKPFARVLHHPVTGATEAWTGFLGHVQGKSIVRTTARVSAHDSHRWAPEQVTPPGDRPLFAELPTLEKGWHAHYFLTSGSHLAEKGAKHSFQPGVWPCQTPVEKPIEVFKETARTGTREQVEASATEHFLLPLEKLEAAAGRGELTLDNRIRRIVEAAEADFESRNEAPGRATRISITPRHPADPLNYDPSAVDPGVLSGFYPVELWQNIPFRWIEPAASIELAVPPGEYFLEIATVPGIDHSEQRLDALSLRIDGREIEALNCDTEAGQVSAPVSIGEGDPGRLFLGFPDDAAFIRNDGKRTLAFPLRRLRFVPKA